MFWNILKGSSFVLAAIAAFAGSRAFGQAGVSPLIGHSAPSAGNPVSPSEVVLSRIIYQHSSQLKCGGMGLISCQATFPTMSAKQRLELAGISCNGEGVGAAVASAFYAVPPAIRGFTIAIPLVTQTDLGGLRIFEFNLATTMYVPPKNALTAAVVFTAQPFTTPVCQIFGQLVTLK